MKETPILFSGEMVRAILKGRKTQTRRIIKPQPGEHIDSLHAGKLRNRAPYELRDDNDNHAGFGFQDDCGGFWRVPYGQPGDRLWVLETWAAYTSGHPETGEDDEIECAPNDMPERYGTNQRHCVYKANGTNFPNRWRPSIHMPRWASRITLEIVSVRVERLQDISVSDCRAEGIESDYRGKKVPDRGGWQNAEVVDYSILWDSINGKRKEGKPDVSWAANPWVWVVEFKQA